VNTVKITALTIGVGMKSSNMLLPPSPLLYGVGGGATRKF